jgi:hypothetical protein
MASPARLYEPAHATMNLKKGSFSVKQIRVQLYRVIIDEPTYFKLAPKAGTLLPASLFFTHETAKKVFSAKLGPIAKGQKPRANGSGWDIRYSFNIQLQLT